jgi:hypothetical protein
MALNQQTNIHLLYGKGNENHELGTDIGNGSLHEISNDNGDRTVNFATYKNLFIKSTMISATNFIQNFIQYLKVKSIYR